MPVVNTTTLAVCLQLAAMLVVRLDSVGLSDSETVINTSSGVIIL